MSNSSSNETSKLFTDFSAVFFCSLLSLVKKSRNEEELGVESFLGKTLPSLLDQNIMRKVSFQVSLVTVYCLCLLLVVLEVSSKEFKHGQRSVVFHVSPFDSSEPRDFR